MVAVFQSDISADALKDKARSLGADLVGIADSAVLNAHPPDPDNPRRPSDISDHDADRVIVLAKRIGSGTTRIKRWDERHKYYNDELALTSLEETSLELVLWLEKQGYPALIIPPTHIDPWDYQGNPGAHLGQLISLDHAAVEAGLGTLGLNLQLLTSDFGPRVILTAVLSSVPVAPDSRMTDALCLGPQCGRCLSACPGDVIGLWQRDWEACDSYRSPHGFRHLTDFLGSVIDQTDPATQKQMIRSEDSFNLWQSILRGAGVVTGCRRCKDVCPVGADYEAMLKDALNEIPEATPAKEERLRQMQRDVEYPSGYASQSRWIGSLPDE